MKVLMINGSANVQGCTYTALKEIEKELNAQNIETEIVSLGNKPIRDCMGCCSCRNTASNKCVFEDVQILNINLLPQLFQHVVQVQQPA